MKRRPTEVEMPWVMDPRPDADGWVKAERHSVFSDQLPERIRVRVQPDAAGRLEIREVHLLDLGEPVTAQRLRALNLGVVGQMIDAHAIIAAQAGEQPRRRRSLKPPASRGYSDDFYERVAARYREARAAGGGKPVMAIAEEAGVPRSTAARWVKEARRRGKLGSARQGQAGG